MNHDSEKNHTSLAVRESNRKETGAVREGTIGRLEKTESWEASCDIRCGQKKNLMYGCIPKKCILSM